MSNEESDVIQELRRVIVELSDCFERETNSRFFSENTDLWSSMVALWPSHYDFLDSSTLKPLFEYMLTIPAISLKLRVVYLPMIMARLGRPLSKIKHTFSTPLPPRRNTAGKIKRRNF